MIRVHDVLAGTNGRLEGNLSDQSLFQRVIHDSRAVRPGDLFVAIQGERLDGHAFLADARRAGASGAIVSEAWLADSEQLPLPVIVVDDTLTALRNLAIYWRGLFKLTVIGITGSIGKSSTKEVVAAILGSKFRVVKSVGSYNNEIGLPLSVLSVTPDTEVLVLEMGGAYRSGEISELAEVAVPDIGIVTNVTHSHLQRMGSLDAIAETKSELVASLPHQGLALLNLDDERVSGMREVARSRVLTYGLAESADIRAENVVGLGAEGLSFTLLHGGQRDFVQVPLLGRHSIHMALIGIAIGFELGMDLGETLHGFESPDIQLRLVLTPAIHGATILDDHYNANPKSCLAALSLLEDLDAERRIAVFGDMLEMGDYEEEAHRTVGRRVIAVVDALYTIGPRAAYISDEARRIRPELPNFYFDDKPALTDALRHAMRNGDLVLVKGSRGVQMETVIEDLRVQDDPDHRA